MRVFRYLIACLLAVPVPSARADLVVVAHPQSGIERLSRDDVVNIYLGRYRRLASGGVAEPLDLPIDSELRSRFYRGLVDKNPAEINAYWARLVFSGKTRPPQVVDTVENALRLVATYPQALAYIQRSRVDARVKVVFELGD